MDGRISHFKRKTTDKDADAGKIEYKWYTDEIR